MKRVLSIIVVFLLVLCGLGFLSMNWLLHNMKGQIESALGEGAHVESIQINWPTIQITELRIDAPKNWPSKETLRAKRIVIEPDLRSLFSKTIRVHQIIAEEAYLSIIRMPQGGIKLLPSLLDKPTKSDVQKEQGTSSADEGNSAYSLIIGSVDLKNSSIDFFDQTLRKKAHRITVSQLNGSVSQIDLPRHC